jgi:hypothetical protein
LRTTCESYVIDEGADDNQFVHLTNFAVQRCSDKFGNFEEANQLPLGFMQNYMDQNFPEKKFNLKDDLMAKIKSIIVRSLYAVRKKIDVN